MKATNGPHSAGPQSAGPHSAGPHSAFQHFAIRSADAVGSWGAFMIAVAVILAWAVTGHLFRYSDTWQLWINTGTTIVTFLIVFLIQYTQNRDARAMHLKLDELLRAIKGAHTEMINLKNLSDEELAKLEQAFDRLARYAAHTRSASAMTNGLGLAPGARYGLNHGQGRRAMIKVSVMYPNKSGARFDHAYYRDKHMPLVQKLMGSACRFYTVDKGLAGGGPGDPPTYIGMCHIYCDSVEAFQAGFGPHAQQIMGDIPNYTDLTPVVQISEVVVGQP